jgi:hypothetical protein
MSHLDQFEGLVSSGRVVSSKVSVIWFVDHLEIKK